MYILSLRILFSSLSPSQKEFRNPKNNIQPLNKQLKSVIIGMMSHITQSTQIDQPVYIFAENTLNIFDAIKHSNVKYVHCQ